MFNWPHDWYDSCTLVTVAKLNRTSCAANFTNDTIHYTLFRINFEQNIRISIHNTLHCTNISKEKTAFGQFPPKNKYNNTTFPFTKILCVISSFNKSVIPQAVLRMTFISILNQCIISVFCLQESRASLYVCLFFMFACSLWMLSITA